HGFSPLYDVNTVTRGEPVEKANASGQPAALVILGSRGERGTPDFATDAPGAVAFQSRGIDAPLCRSLQPTLQCGGIVLPRTVPIRYPQPIQSPAPGA